MRTPTNRTARRTTPPAPAAAGRHHARRGARDVARKAAALIALICTVAPLTACLPADEPVVSRPEGGPFDPGQNGLPDQLRVESICGSAIVNGLRTLSERYYDIAREWERYKAYAGGVSADGVTAEEYAGAEQRGENIASYVEEYRAAAEELRATAGTITGDFVAECDRDVVVRFEALYQERDTEITYVASESARTTKRLRKSAGVAETE